MNTTLTTQAERNTRAFIADHTIEIIGTLHFNIEDYYNEDTHTRHIYHYGLNNVLYWNTTTRSFQTLSKDPDKFQCFSSHSLAEARTEFWQRFNLYIKRRFGHSVKVTINTK